MKWDWWFEFSHLTYNHWTSPYYGGVLSDIAYKTFRGNNTLGLLQAPRPADFRCRIFDNGFLFQTRQVTCHQHRFNQVRTIKFNEKIAVDWWSRGIYHPSHGVVYGVKLRINTINLSRNPWYWQLSPHYMIQITSQHKIWKLAPDWTILRFIGVIHLSPSSNQGSTDSPRFYVFSWSGLGP